MAGLRDGADPFFYFVLNLFLSLMVTEGLMLCIAVIVPHYLMGIAGGAGIMGLFMLVCGFIQARIKLPGPVWKYPLHYISFQTYSFTGLMNNEFGDTDGWQCPCALTSAADDPNCPSTCKISGDEAIEAFGVEVRDKWVEIGILVGMFVGYRLLFLFLLHLREIRQKSR